MKRDLSLVFMCMKYKIKTFLYTIQSFGVTLFKKKKTSAVITRKFLEITDNFCNGKNFFIQV